MNLNHQTENGAKTQIDFVFRVMFGNLCFDAICIQFFPGFSPPNPTLQVRLNTYIVILFAFCKKVLRTPA